MSQIKLFQQYEIRSYWYEEKQKWYFSVVDVVGVLSESNNSRRYWSDLKRKLKKEGAEQLYENLVQLKLKAPDGRMRETDLADTETLLRIIQSVPSPNAEPFKLWLAQVGRERLDEVENPELAAERIREMYRAKGYDEQWIETRLQSIAVRNELTDEWESRDVRQGKEYAILTAEISRETFGISPTTHKEIKQLRRGNLRDHMTPLELAFTILGEATTIENARDEDAQGFDENFDAAQRGGRAAGLARKALEAERGKPVVSAKNYWPASKKKSLEETTSVAKEGEDDVPF